jgi:adenylate kinase
MTHLRDFIAAKGDYETEEIGVYSLESFLPGNISVTDLLGAEVQDGLKRQKWKNAASAMKARIEEDDCRINFIAFHATYNRQNRIMSFFDLPILKEFKPELLITLIDDVYSIWEEVNFDREKELMTNSYFTLADLANWRWSEVMTSDHIAVELDCPSYVVSINHPISMLYKLVMHRSDNLIVYACVPISSTRNDPLKREEINKHREEIHGRYIVFDPLTIDEKILTFSLTEQFPNWWKKEGTTLYGKELKLADRWPASFSDKTELAIICNERPLPILNAGEVVEVCRAKSRDRQPVKDANYEIQDSVIDQHVRLRDYKLISNCQALSAYRPGYKGKTPGGQREEINFAERLSLEKQFYVAIYHDKDKDDPLKGGTFPPITSLALNSEEELFKQLDSFRDKTMEVKNHEEVH